MTLPTRSYSQAAQDTWVLRCTNFMRCGYYVDCGAFDGLEHSNSALLDFEYGWSGICVEANQQYAAACAKNRPNTKTLNVAVADYEGNIHFSNQWPSLDPTTPIVRCTTLQTILDECNAPRMIDYLSLDVEGFEAKVLRSFDFEKYQINLMTVEHNMYADGPSFKEEIAGVLLGQGFVRCVDNAICLDQLYAGSRYEDWWINPRLLPNDEAFIQRVL
jgi:FkbM family methyltransferase